MAFDINSAKAALEGGMSEAQELIRDTSESPDGPEVRSGPIQGLISRRLISGSRNGITI